jgi:hypothetical protein
LEKDFGELAAEICAATEVFSRVAAPAMAKPIDVGQPLAELIIARDGWAGFSVVDPVARDELF